MTDSKPYTFIEDNCIRVAPVNHGWQVQWREDTNSPWQDIPNAWYKHIAQGVVAASDFIKA